MCACVWAAAGCAMNSHSELIDVSEIPQPLEGDEVQHRTDMYWCALGGLLVA